MHIPYLNMSCLLQQHGCHKHKQSEPNEGRDSDGKLYLKYSIEHKQFELVNYGLFVLSEDTFCQLMQSSLEIQLQMNICSYIVCTVC